ncbi:CoA-binding protein [Pannus brasiliensis CCIBt3594]|uniref:CoA-binding protein n=1 Tax=Pannus brasiliensis CCIBt3594 TaxID=1427578 RepID=A0AAW9QQS1_9CHRO
MKWTPTGKVLIQGIEKPLARSYAARMREKGTNIVAGVAIGRGGTSIEGIPVFDLVEKAIATEGSIETSLLFVDPYRVLDAALEAIDAGIRQLIIVTGGVPPLDTVELLKKASATGTFILGPGSSGLIIPGQLWLGTCEPGFYRSGDIGLIAKGAALPGASGDRLIDEVARTITAAGFGLTMAVSLGTDGILGSNLSQWLQVLEEDENTRAIVLVSQIGGKAEIDAARYIAEAIEKPVIAYITGLNSPIESRFADADTIIKGALSYTEAISRLRRDIPRYFEEAGVTAIEKLSELPEYLEIVLS